MSEIGLELHTGAPDALLTRIVRLPVVHARFLNTLSMMEYIGARKIMKSQADRYFDVELLGHVVEETRHAYALKRMAVSVDPAMAGPYCAEQMLGRDEGVRYMQTLDRAVEADLAASNSSMFVVGGRNVQWVNYLYTSLLIEERADVFYPSYILALKEAGQGAGILRSIIRDESKHLAAMRRETIQHDAGHVRRLEGLRKVERDAFGTFWSAVAVAVTTLEESV